MLGYCMKCKTKREMKEVKSSKTKRGTTMNKGKCTTCGCNMCLISK